MNRSDRLFLGMLIVIAVGLILWMMRLGGLL
jgi:hypothetical protein